jgi:hypothetical protein
MGTSKTAGARLHGALHRLPGMPAHARAAELNANAAARRLHHRPLRNRALRNTPLRSPDGHHGRPPRLLAGWQAWIGRRLGQGQR